MKKQFTIGSLVFLQLAGQFIVQLLIVRFLGVSLETDAYVSSQTLPLFVGGITTSILHSVWMPKLSVINDEKIWNEKISIAFSQILILSFVLVLIIIFFILFYSKHINPGFSINQINLYNKYSFISLLSLFFLNLSSMLTIALRSKEKFVKSELSVTFSAILTLPIVYFILPKTGIEFLLYAFLFRNIVVFIYLLHINNWPKLNLSGELIKKEVWLPILPLFLGAGIFKTSTLVDRYWASQAPTGSITILYLAQMLMTAIATIIERSISSPLIPKISKFVYSKNMLGVNLLLKNLLFQSFVFVFLIVIFVSFTNNYLVVPISYFLGISVFDSNEVLLAFVSLGGHLFSAIVGGAIVAVYYAFGDTLTPVFIGLLGFFVGILLKNILFDLYGILGLGISNSIYFCFNLILFLIFLKFKNNFDYEGRFQLFR